MEKKGSGILLLLVLSVLPTFSLGFSREYYFIPLHKCWTEAQSYCRENFADLATIETAEDWAKVRQIMQRYGTNAWIGLYDELKGWRWSMDNTYLYGDDRNTELGEWLVFAVDNFQGKEHCVEIYMGTLNDQSCSFLRKSVCYDESTQKYIPVMAPMTWLSAQSNCREKYTDLTSIRNQQEKEKIMSVIDQSHWWIGLSRDVWTWSDQSNSSFRVWRYREPNGRGSERCVCSLETGWYDLYCDRKTPFICSVPIIRLLRIVLKSNGSVDLNDPSAQEAVLNHMERRMRDHGIGQKFRLKWKKQPNGKVFH
ncbi:macrophage mannose receptor 1-like [Plectropomus leopardus]|uniref:macrophage mannose receptor 1-like n=1 Tax=Plectropomus leopardus TaxID=160734 RepID=UPI001C4D353F|nr:macrophage mannose receptor 1-like [Plectropomus leopardus]